MLSGKAKEGWSTLGCGGDGATIGDDVLSGDVLFQFENVDVIVAVLVSIADGHVPHPEVSETGADGPFSVVASCVFNDGDVAGFAGRCACVVGLERVVLLVDDNVNGVVSSEFTDFHLLDVGILVPVCISALIARHPNILALVKIAASVVVEDGHGVCTVGRNRQIVVAVAVEIPDSEVGRVTMGRV